MYRIKILLLVDVLQFCIPKANLSSLVIERVLTTEKIESIRYRSRPTRHEHFFHAAIVSRAIASKLTSIKCNVFDFFRCDLCAPECLR
ncbi:hypothetical protein D3C79_639950 [compost metagenome]